jgi:hypothetical protein
MVSIDQTRKHLLSRGHHVLALAGMALLALGLAQPHAETMGPPSGQMPEVDPEFADNLLKDPDVIFIPVIRSGAPPEVLQRRGGVRAAHRQGLRRGHREGVHRGAGRVAR